MRNFMIGTALALALGVTQANADFVLGGQTWSFNGVDNLTLTPVVPGGNQPQNIPCVICGDNQPQQPAGFGYTDYHNMGSLTDAAFFSTDVLGGGNPGLNTIGVGYDGSFLRTFLQNAGDTSLKFNIGIDINDNGTPQILDSFYLFNLTTHTVLAAFTTPTAVPSQNNGTGFPDYTLTGFDINLGTDIHAGDQLIFYANLNNQNDGPDSFFLVPSVAAVPGPTLGAGVPGLLAGGMAMILLSRFRRRDAIAVQDK